MSDLIGTLSSDEDDIVDDKNVSLDGSVGRSDHSRSLRQEKKSRLKKVKKTIKGKSESKSQLESSQRLLHGDDDDRVNDDEVERKGRRGEGADQKTRKAEQGNEEEEAELEEREEEFFAGFQGVEFENEHGMDTVRSIHSNGVERHASTNRAGSGGWAYGRALAEVVDYPELDGEDSIMTSTTEKIARYRAKSGNSYSIRVDRAASSSESFRRDQVQGRPLEVRHDVSFADLHLSRPLLRAITVLGYSNPTPIQAEAIPKALAGHDLCGSAVTGSGKTAAFLLPSVERLLLRNKRMAATKVLVLLPTRELAVQCHEVLLQIAQFSDISSCLCVGGLSITKQEQQLRLRPDVVIATPGRLVDHIQNTHSFSLDEIEILVLDEADRLLDMGFELELEEIIRACPRSRQTMLFSATLTDEVDRLVKLSLKNPIRLSVGEKFRTAPNLTQEVVRIRASLQAAIHAEREAVIMALLSRVYNRSVLIFVRHKRDAHRLRLLIGLLFGDDIRVDELHGNLTQKQRLDALEGFRVGAANVLVCTDVAARGLDIPGVETVIHFDSPSTAREYVHRVGRTARAGASGSSIALAAESDRNLLKKIQKTTGDQFSQRIIPSPILDEIRAALEGVERDVQAIIREESEERELRIAEMEARKAENLIDHESEIYSRPARTWIASKREKLLRRRMKSTEADNLGEKNRVDASAIRRSKKRSFSDDGEVNEEVEDDYPSDGDPGCVDSGDESIRNSRSFTSEKKISTRDKASGRFGELPQKKQKRFVEKRTKSKTERSFERKDREVRGESGMSLKQIKLQARAIKKTSRGGFPRSKNDSGRGGSSSNRNTSRGGQGNGSGMFSREFSSASEGFSARRPRGSARGRGRGRR